MPVPGWRLRISFAASMPSCWNDGGIRMSVTTTCGVSSSAACDQLVEVGRLADDLDAGREAQQRLHARAHEQVVVGQHDADLTVAPGRGSHGGPSKPTEEPCGKEAVRTFRWVQAPLGRAPEHTLARRAPTWEDHLRMRTTSSVTTISWIPSEAVTGINKAMFETGFTHYDDPPPDVIDDLDGAADRRQVPLRERARACGRSSTGTAAPAPATRTGAGR